MRRVEALLPAPASAADLDGPELDAWLTNRYLLAGDRWVRLNLVTALGGQVTGDGGTSDDLTGGIDRVLLGVIRRTGDVVLVGAGSLRTERLRMPATAALAIATRSGDIDADLLPESTADGRRPIVLCPPDAADRLERALGDRAEVAPAPPDTGRFERPATLQAGSAVGLIVTLERRGFSRVVCEGGAVLASALLAAGVVDEFDQTIAPVLTGPGATITAPGSSARLDGLLRDETDRLYARWRLRRR